MDYFSNEFLIPPSNLINQLSRLKNLTGFVTVIALPNDPRPLAFARYYHVERVVLLTKIISNLRRSESISVDYKKAELLAWVHDLNRWPFSHNSETGLFIQEDHFPLYVKENNLSLSKNVIEDIQGIITKSFDNLSIEGKIVLLADMISGFFEDPLWITVALNIHPDIIPQSIAKYLGIPVDNPIFIESLYKLNVFFYERREIKKFMQQFNSIFLDLAESFIINNRIAITLPLGEKYFEEIRINVKENFMRKIIFPYNNEKISKGTTLKKDLIRPLLKKLGEKVHSLLTTLDDNELVDLAIEEKIISASEKSRFYPELDYIIKNEPEKSFRDTYFIHTDKET